MATQSQNISSAEFVEQLKKEIQAFPKIRIKHPFLKAVCAGTATMDQIRAWAIQDYQFRAAVPRIAMLRYLACTDPEIAQKLWGVVEEETRAIGDEPGAAVGVLREQLTQMAIADLAVVLLEGRPGRPLPELRFRAHEPQPNYERLSAPS